MKSNRSKRVVRVPKDYYYRVHETRYRKILGSGSVFRQKQMNSHILSAWNEFVSTVNLVPEVSGIEFGCGTGINTITISEQGFQMTGIDISPTVIEKAKELAQNKGEIVEFIVGDMFATNLSSESFDFAINIWTLHVVGEQHLRDKHLSECYRVLKPGGYLFLHNESSDKDILNPIEEVVFEEAKEWNIPELKNKFELPNGEKIQVSFPAHMPPDMNGRRSLGEHKDELEKAGFKILKCYGDEMSASHSVSGNQVMIAFAYKEK
ncbi:MAG: class I SAM-dependent methyltransferase [Candidatus Aegiribacteria sp.]|nr:class I SAM-dependent methyltransferase [Candidatus Aegiribacteria sp.]